MTLVVPFAAGGGTDVVARIVAPRLGEFLGQQVVIENVGGAGGMTGSNRVARAAPTPAWPIPSSRRGSPTSAA
jgi:tripartite-type tricarboxylate transporter receptor subunit TctC